MEVIELVAEERQEFLKEGVDCWVILLELQLLCLGVGEQTAELCVLVSHFSKENEVPTS